MIGGYKVIDLKNIKIDDSTGATIPGLYEAIEGATKPIQLRGVNLDGTEIKPSFISPYVSSSKYYFTIANVTAYVDDDDLIKYTENE